MKNFYVTFAFALLLGVGVCGCQSASMSSSINHVDVNQGSDNQADTDQKPATHKTPIHNQSQKNRCNC